MKFLFLSLFFLFSLGSIGQRIVEYPRFGSSTSQTRTITQIELTDTATVLYIDVVNRPHWRIKVEKEEYICPAEGGEKLRIKATEGIPLNKEFFVPASGKHSFKAIFPALPVGVTHIDWYLGEQEGIFDIALTKKPEKRLFPEALRGNWLKADGSGEWIYSFEDRFAVMDQDFWEYVEVKTRGKLTEFHLQNGNQKKVVYARLGKEGQVQIGENKKMLETVVAKRQVDKAAIAKLEDKENGTIFKNGVAVLKGFIKGYSPKMGERRAEVYLNDFFSGYQENLEMTVKNDGRFELKMEMNYQEPVLMRFPFYMNFSVLMEPGKTTFMCLDMGQYIDPWRQTEDVSKRKKTSLFMGDNAQINYEYQAGNDFFKVDYRKLKKDVKGFTPEQFKKHLTAIKVKALERLAEYEQKQGISTRGKKLLTALIDLEYCYWLFDYNDIREENWRDANKKKKPQERSPFHKIEPEREYYSSLKEIELGDEGTILTGGSLGMVINRIKYVARKAERTLDWELLVSELEKGGIELTDKEKEFFDLLSQLEQDIQPDTVLIKRLQTEFKSVNDGIATKYGQQIQKLSQALIQEKKQEILLSYFGVEPGFVTDVMDLQNQIRLLDQTFEVMTDQQLEEYRKKCHIPFVAEYLIRYNQKLKEKLEANKNKTDYVVHKIPEVENEKLFDAIMKQFKGKVVFVDFWATWCAPCRNGIKKMKSVKEELANQNIAFVYITGETSPQKTYENMIPDIRGHHFRLSADQWKYVCKQFKINGIPHYMLVDKSGRIVEKKFNGWQEKPAIKAALLKCINKKTE